MRVAATVSNELGAALQRARIAARLADAQSPSEVARIVVEELRTAAGADSAILATPTDDGRHLVLASSGLEDPIAREYTTLPADTALPIGRVFASGAPAFAETRAEVLAAFPPGPPPRSSAFAAVPVRGARAVAAAFALGFDHPRRLGVRDRDALLDVARMVGAALERARLREAERTAHARLAVLAEASTRFLAASPDLGALLEIAAELLSEATGDLAVVRLLAPDGSRFRETAFRHPDAPLREEFGAALAADPGDPAEGHRASVIASGRTTFLPVAGAAFGAAAPPGFRRYLARHPAHGAVIAPLLADGRVIGTAAVIRHRPHAPYGTHDRHVVEGIADRAALAVALARLHAAHRDAREAAERALQRAEVASRAKDEFLAMLSHELRNPLAPIVTALQLMKLRGAEGGRERDVIERQVTHLLRLVDDLLDVSRVTRGKVRLERQAVEASQIVARAVELASPLLEERRHTLTVEVAEGLRLDADPGRMAQVVSNLLTNAAKYTDPGGRIAIRASAERACGRLAVTDTGIGISPALLPRIFDLFVQGDRDFDRSPGGLGIGLTIVRSLVELHGGRVAAESGARGGSTFTVWVPLATSAADPVPAPPPPQPAASTPLRVLVVDDNEDAAELLAEALRARGHDARTAFDGPSALGLADAFRPEVALLDLGLPVMDGYELARRLRERPAALAVALAAVTGYGQDLDRRRSLAAGFREHLVKPVELDRVCEVVERLAPAR